MNMYRIYYQDFRNDYKDNTLIESTCEADAIKAFKEKYKYYDVILVVDEGKC